ncbi:MAG: NAD-glutamate dehydrogenase [Campylobacterales bacterium]|nr:NAD-glutamate dehydrogenase [Campylobacterales bacterium]
MKEEKELTSICAQLLDKNDLIISDAILKRIFKEKIVTSIMENNDLKSLKIFSLKKIHLSSITPVLHDIGFEIIDEVTYKINIDNKGIYISKFNFNLLETKKIRIAQENIEKLINISLLDDSVSHSKVYSLVYEQNLDLRKISLIRSFIEYIDQTVLDINTSAILNTFTSHSHITKLFIDYFIAKFDPDNKNAKKQMENILLEIKEEIKIIPQIIDDKILNLTLSLLQCLLRTNYFFNESTIAFKINTKEFSLNLKGLQPNIENFIYHNDFYGIHLRMTKVSRGGLRWSDRLEDYRQEIKSLMITQESKNSIIIPDGSKGGFVINSKKEITKEYFTEIYSLYINANLDLVDNRFNNEIIRDKRIVAYDEDDAYFVVAADKGTASMSDIANDISISRNYWLGDAFASGGTNGYGHKDLGITARGSIMSTKRFFIEEGIDIYKDEISIVGIGSMKGDVFGNGMIESSSFKLYAAISQREIFVDPNPNVKVAFNERKRLFVSSKASWLDYKKDLISEGGGVFLRADKEIILSDEVKKLIKTSRKTISGEELAKAVLCLKVDLLFNGGVGTYVKASEENSLDIGDKQNEAVRVEANQIKARIVCEGGNLGFTQKARIEYSLNGGKINLDAIDNAGGVDTSDREVNLKILLNEIKNEKLLDENEAISALHSLTDVIVSEVLQSTYNQALSISIDERFSRRYLSDFLRTIEVIEDNIESFNRKSFYIPKNENINEIIDKNSSIVRPVLGTLLSYSKIFIKKILMDSSLIDESYFIKFLHNYFPTSFLGAYEKEINTHALKREIIATKLADFLINSQGSTFVSDFQRLGKDKFLMKIKAYIIVSDLFDAKKIREIIFENDNKMPAEEQYKLINKLEYTLYASTRWMVKYLKSNQLDANHILDYQEELFVLLKEVHKGPIKEIIKGEDEFNLFYAVINYLRFSVAAINIKENSSHTFKDVMVIFYSLLHEFKILEIIIALNRVKIVKESDMTIRSQILQFIEYIVVHYTNKILDFKRLNEDSNLAFDNFIKNEDNSIHKVKIYLDKFLEKENKDLKEISITVNQLMVSLL